MKDMALGSLIWKGCVPFAKEFGFCL